MKIKGQGVIAEILIFGAVLMISLSMLFLVTMGDDNPVKEENIETSLMREASAVEDQALMTYILQNHIDGDINAGQEVDTSIFRNINTPSKSSGSGTICDSNCDDDDLDGIEENLPSSYQLHNSAEDLEDEVEDYHKDDPRRIQYNQFANSSHPSYEPNIRWYGEHSDYHENRRGGCNFDIDDSSNPQE